ncbi:MAG: hypothetical protein ACQEVA_19525 [Myxococcota bacterium]
MTTRRLLVVFAALVVSSLIIGCGNDDPEEDFEGTYEVIQHTRNNSGCEVSGGAVAGGDSHFRLQERDGQLAYYACTSAAECEDFANDTRSFDERDGDDWVKVTANADERSDTCDLQVVERRLGPATNGIRLTREKRERLYQMPDFECTQQEAIARSAELECTETETIIAVPAG